MMILMMVTTTYCKDYDADMDGVDDNQDDDDDNDFDDDDAECIYKFEQNEFHISS